MDLDKLAENLRGKRFGDLVLHHYRKSSLADTIVALLGTEDELPEVARNDVEGWIDFVNPLGTQESFWRTDCAEILQTLTATADERLRARGVDPTTDHLFSMFQIIVLSFAYTAHKERQSRMFIQKAVGQGFMRRLLNI